MIWYWMFITLVHCERLYHSSLGMVYQPSLTSTNHFKTSTINCSLYSPQTNNDCLAFINKALTNHWSTVVINQHVPSLIVNVQYWPACHRHSLLTVVINNHKQSTADGLMDHFYTTIKHQWIRMINNDRKPTSSIINHHWPSVNVVDHRKPPNSPSSSIHHLYPNCSQPNTLNPSWIMRRYSQAVPPMHQRQSTIN